MGWWQGLFIIRELHQLRLVVFCPLATSTATLSQRERSACSISWKSISSLVPSALVVLSCNICPPILVHVAAGECSKPSSSIHRSPSMALTFLGKVFLWYLRLRWIFIFTANTYNSSSYWIKHIAGFKREMRSGRWKQAVKGFHFPNFSKIEKIIF